MWYIFNNRSPDLINNLKTCSPPMHRLYLIFKSRKATEPITSREVDIASGRFRMTPEETSTYLKALEHGSSLNPLPDAFNKQTANAAVRYSVKLKYLPLT